MKVSLIVLAAFGLVTLMRSRSAALRHWILAVAVGCATLIPALETVVPSWRVPLNTASTIQGIGRGAQTALVSEASRTRLPEPQPAIGSAGVGPLAAFGTFIDLWRPIWVTGITIGLLLLAAGLGRLTWLAWRARPVTDARWTAALTGISSDSGVRRPILLLQSDHSSLLVTWGMRRPKIILPAGAMEWPQDLRRIVLCHEIAHIRRGDWSAQMLGEVLRAIYWFNPLVWLVCGRLRLESERACDDEVLSSGVQGPDYAKHLLDLARMLNVSRHSWLPATAMARQSNLRRRVTAMLNDHVNRTPTSRPARAAIMMALLAVTVAIAAAQTFVTFSGSILDPQGAALPNAKLTLSNEQRGAKYEIRTDRGGQFEFVGLPPGDYVFEAQVPGFMTFRQPLSVGGENVQRGIKLEIGTLEETITVTYGPETPSSRPRVEQVGPRPNPPCKAGPTDGSVPVGGNLRPPVKIRHVAPIFPFQLRGTGTEGTVLMEGRIGLDGFVKDIRVRNQPNPEFAEAAIDAVSQWQFDSTLLNCVPVEVLMTMTVNFKHEK